MLQAAPETHLGVAVPNVGHIVYAVQVAVARRVEQFAAMCCHNMQWVVKEECNVGTQVAPALLDNLLTAERPTLLGRKFTRHAPVAVCWEPCKVCQGSRAGRWPTGGGPGAWLG